MKITCSPITPRLTSRPFPKLMVSGEGRIVFFTADTCGFSLVGTSGRPHYYSQYWNPAEFEDYTGTVTIQDGDQ